MNLTITPPPQSKPRTYPYFANHCNDGDVLYAVVAPHRVIRLGTTFEGPWMDVRDMSENYLIPLPNGTTIVVTDNE
jgi:endonuclease/exonuclease/phosphatase (EEP) superfamily protein YafD